MEPIRVTHVCGTMLTGSTRVTLNLLRLHDRSQFAPAGCFFAVAAAHPALLAEVSELGVPHAVVLKRARYDFTAIARLAGALRELRTEMVVLHGFGPQTSGAPAARLVGVKAVVRVEHAAELYTAKHRLVARVTAPLTDSTILVSAYLGRYLAAQRVQTPHPEVIHNGIDLTPFLAVTRLPLSRAGPPVLFMAGRMDEYKDQATLIDAVGLLRDGGVATRLRLAGDGPLLQALAARVERLRLQPMVEFLGQRFDIPQLLADADIAVLSTHLEGFGLVVAEAMAAARPTVASDVGALPELIDSPGVGVLVPPRHPTRLASAIEGLLADPGRARRMGEAAREQARVRFRLEHWARRFERHLLETAVRRGIRQPR